MDEKEKIRAGIETRLQHFNQTLTEIKQRAETQQEKASGVTAGHPVSELEEKINVVQRKAGELVKHDDDAWRSVHAELEKYLADIDRGLRDALAYYK